MSSAVHRSGAGRRNLAVAVLTLVSTLVGAVLGTAVTLLVFRLQYDAALAAEQRAERRAVYAEYLEAATALLRTEIELVSTYDRCLNVIDIVIDDKLTKRCQIWDGAVLTDPRNRWFDAWQQLRIYGSPEILRIATSINDQVLPVDPAFLPLARGLEVFYQRPNRTIDDFAAHQQAEAKALQFNNDSAAEFARQMCVDISTEPDRCGEAFATEAPFGD